jgi:hypothetical protein
MSPVSSAVRYALRNGWERGVLDGNRAWVVIGGAAAIAYLAGRALPRRAETVFSSVILPGEALSITNEARH